LGVAIDVPLYDTYWLAVLAFGALMFTPGAAMSGLMRSSRVGPRLEKAASP